MYAPRMSSFAPVLVTGFNRPEMLEAQLQSLLGRGCKIYVSLDIPRKDDQANIEASRRCVQVVENFSTDLAGVRISTQNLGCFRGVTEAITWGFENEKKLLILEDDIRVNELFLSFSTKMLEQFETNRGVGSIAGTNLVPKSHITHKEEAIRFSAFTSSWGWATWKDRWADYLQDLEKFPRQDYSFPTQFWSWASKRYWKKIFQDTVSGKYDAWDYRWLNSNWNRHRLTLIPNSNLAINVGFGAGATHTHDSELPWWLPVTIADTFEVPVNTPPLVRDQRADRWQSENHYRTRMIQQFRSELSYRFPRSAVVYRRLAGRA